MITSETDGNSPAAASEPPTTAIDGVAENARAAQVVASASESFLKRGMGAATQPRRGTCGQPAKRRNSPGPGAAGDVDSTPGRGHQQQAPADHHRALVAEVAEALEPRVRDLGDLGDPVRAVDAERERARERRPHVVLVVAHGGDHREPLGRPPEERVVVVLDGRPGVPADAVLVEPDGLREVRDVEQRQLHARAPALVGRVLADPEQQPVAERVQVRGVAGDLELARHPRRLRVGEVERVQRVDLAERHHEARVADVADRVDPLAAPEPADAADLHEPPVALLQRAHRALGRGAAVPRRHRGRRRAQRPLVLGQRPLVEQVAGHLAAADVGRLARLLGRERVQPGGRLVEDLAARSRRSSQRCEAT